MAPQEVRSSSGPGPQKRRCTVDEARIHPETEAGDPFAYAAAPDRDGPPHACCCLEGWVFVSYIDEDGQEREASYRCRRCASGDGNACVHRI